MSISSKDFGGGANRELWENSLRFRKEYRSLLLHAYYCLLRISFRIPLAETEAIANAKLDYWWTFYRTPDAAWQALRQNGGVSLMPTTN